MKTARTFLPLLILTLAIFAPRGTARAQAKDSIYVTVDKIAGNAGFHFTFHHTGTDLRPVSNIMLLIDPKVYPYVGFDPDVTGTENPAFSQYQWSSNEGLTSYDSVWWCNSTYSIPRPQQDSFFVFGLFPNPNMTNAPSIYDSAITIQWIASFQSNDCTVTSQISSGSFQVIPTFFQSYPPFDTMTATTSTPLCDPIFNFTVHDRNGLQSPIGTVNIQLLDQFVGSMRPSDIIAPSGWSVQSVTPNSVTFTAGNIAYLSSLSNFIVGLRANPAATAFSFVLRAYDQSGAPIDRDTSWNISATPAQCSTNSSDDTLRVTNNLGCGFNFNLENSHSGDANLTVSSIDSLVLHITTPGVTWSSATAPTQAPRLCWSYAGLTTPTLSFQSCAQPSGLTWTYGASIDNPNQLLVTVQWSDFENSVEVSSGTDTFRCMPTPDSVYVDALGSCGYRVRVKNAHVPTSNIHSVLFAMPATSGTFTPPYSSNTGWTPNSGNGGLQFTSGSGNGLTPGSTDTFYFSTNQKQTNTPWPMTFQDIEAKTNNTITDTTINNVPGCTPAVICDTATFKQGVTPNTCEDTLSVFSRAIGSGGVDTVWVIPMDGWKVTNASKPTPWVPVITPTGDTLVYVGGNVSESTPRTFVVDFNGDISLPHNFAVQVIIHNKSGQVCTMTENMNCAPTEAVAPREPTAPLLLSIAPNPLHDRTDITLTTGAPDRVQLVLLNVLGQTEETVVDQVLGAGEHTYPLDASTLPAGTYYLRLETNGQVVTKKMVIEK